MEIATAEFKKDLSKHRLWCIIDGAIFIATGLVAIVPGPNLPRTTSSSAASCFFAYRARKGMEASLWTGVPSAPLADLQESLSLDPGRRAQRIDAVARALGLERLSVFMRRVANRPRKA